MKQITSQSYSLGYSSTGIDYIMGHVPPEYSPAHARSTGQFDKPSIEMVPDSYTTKNTLTNAAPADDSYIPITARAAHIYSPDYSAVTNNHWTQIVATTSCLPYNPTLHYTTSNCGGGVSAHRYNYVVTSLSLCSLVDESGDHNKPIRTWKNHTFVVTISYQLS